MKNIFEKLIIKDYYFYHIINIKYDLFIYLNDNLLISDLENTLTINANGEYTYGKYI
jgi:hypothetical protein